MKNYRALIAIPIIAIILCSAYLLMEPELKLDVDFKGGTQIAITSLSSVDTAALERTLSEYEAAVRIGKGLTEYTITITFASDINSNDVMSTLKDSGYNFENFSVQTVAPAISESFFKQAQLALIIAFIFMAIVIFVTFKSALITLYTSLCPMFDIIETLAITQLLGIDLSLASFAALLMIVGYSVDDNVMITARILKRSDVSMNRRLVASLKTSITTVAATAVALFALFIMSASAIIDTIAIVLLIGLLVDLMNTWMLDTNLLLMYVEKKGVK